MITVALSDQRYSLVRGFGILIPTVGDGSRPFVPYKRINGGDADPLTNYFGAHHRPGPNKPRIRNFARIRNKESETKTRESEIKILRIRNQKKGESEAKIHESDTKSRESETKNQKQKNAKQTPKFANQKPKKSTNQKPQAANQKPNSAKQKPKHENQKPKTLESLRDSIQAKWNSDILSLKAQFEQPTIWKCRSQKLDPH